MRFTKMHGLGNDYLFLDACREPSILLRDNLPDLTRRLCDRNEGAGADGVIIISHGPTAPTAPKAPPDPGPSATRTSGSIDPAPHPAPPRTAFHMRILNADGSEGGMCGNGARCACKLAVERGHVHPGADGRLQLRVGPRSLDARVRFDPARPGAVHRVEIDMGPPELDLERVPVDPARLGSRTDPLHAHEHFVEGHPGVFVNMGNPHFVVFTNHDPDTLADRIGPSLETHPAFPQRMNIQVVRVQSPTRLVLRSWERGAGRTRACGTGACAALVAAVLTDRAQRAAVVSMLGGELDIAWPQHPPGGRVLMTGPAAHVYDGEWEDTLADQFDLLARLIPTLRTRRLVLRPYAAQDLPDLQRLMSFPEVSGNTRTWPVPCKPGDAEKFLRRIAAAMIAGESIGWAVCAAESGRFIGSIGLRIDRLARSAEAGYCTLPECWGRGYTTEALAAVVDHAFKVLRLRKVHADHHADNVPSGRVMLKCGFTPVALRRSHFERDGKVHDVVQMDLLNPETV